MKLDVLSPVGEVKAEKQALSERGESLEGKTIAFFSNAKPNVGTLFDNLEKHFSVKFPAIKTVRKEKQNSAFGAPEEIVQETAETADFVVYGVGD
jgi:hypothetical protein